MLRDSSLNTPRSPRHLEAENPTQRSLYIQQPKFSEAQMVDTLKEIELGAKEWQTAGQARISGLRLLGSIGLGGFW